MNNIINELKFMVRIDIKMPGLLFYIYKPLSLIFMATLLFCYLPWPFITDELNENGITYAEFWLSGDAPVSLAINISILGLLNGIAHQKAWARFLLPLLISVVLISGGLASLTGIIISTLISSMLFLYFYKNAKVNAYFNHNYGYEDV